jgi:WD40 repeat protein
MYDLVDGKFIDRFDAFEGDVTELSFTSDGKALVTVDAGIGNVRFWDPATGKVARSLQVPTGRLVALRSARVSPDGKVLALAYQGEARATPGLALKLWDTAADKELPGRPEQFDSAAPMAFSRDGKYLVTRGAPRGDAGRVVRPPDQLFVWEVATGKKIAQFPGAASVVAFAPDGKTLAVAEPTGRIVLRDTTKWAVTGYFRDSRARALSLAIGPDGRVYSGYVDATVLVWDPQRAGPPADQK